jgi:hypothetical protein
MRRQTQLPQVTGWLTRTTAGRQGIGNGKYLGQVVTNMAAKMPTLATPYAHSHPVRRLSLSLFQPTFATFHSSILTVATFEFETISRTTALLAPT